MTRKKSYTIRCDGDGCGKLAEVEDEQLMPEGWLQVRLPGENGRLPTTGFDLCSLRCVGKWSKVRSAVLNGKADQPVHMKKPCPICEEMVAPQGFSMHCHSAHPDEDFDTARQLYAAAEVAA